MHTIALFYFSAIIFCHGLPAEEPLNLKTKSNWVGNPIITANGFQIVRELGSANFSAGLQYPLQIVYDSATPTSGILGISWRIPQLESSLTCTNNIITWHTPWNEIIKFTDNSKPANWLLNPKNEIISGLNHYAGWRFHYQSRRLISITTPPGNILKFEYAGHLLKTVKQADKVLIQTKYANKLLTEITINQVTYKFVYLNGNTAKLKSYSPEMISPTVFSYDRSGSLTSVRNNNYIHIFKGTTTQLSGLPSN